MENDDLKKQIDELFRLFKEKFGCYPQSVGSWVMDAWSIGYMKEKYGIAQDRITYDSKGARVQPFAENDLNRVSICIAE